MNVFSLLLVCLLGFSVRGFAEVVGEEITYEHDGVSFKGYLATDPAVTGTRPGVLVVHEWWGHNDYARKRARMLAELGYTALAVDMYGDGKQAAHPKEAGAFSGAVMANMESAKGRFDAALAVLRKHPSVKAEETAAIGYCFGGGVVLHMARMGTDLKGVASFHGSLKGKTQAEPGNVKTKILVCHGAADKFIPQEDIDGFKAEMDAAGASYEFHAYEGALHSFTNPGADAKAKEFGIPIGYNKAADEQSWKDMQTFFIKLFAK
ncbi:MAG: dienelactone hydrolase [Kiritimatiellia bacterium]|jgi:dienelactone hydrolase